MQSVRPGIGHGLVGIVGGRGMAADQAPAFALAGKDMGHVERPMRIRIIADEQLFGQVMNGEDTALPMGDGLRADANLGAAEDAAPAFADGGIAFEADSGGMNANCFIIRRPAQHQTVAVAGGDCRIKRLFGIFGGVIVNGCHAGGAMWPGVPSIGHIPDRG